MNDAALDGPAIEHLARFVEKSPAPGAPVAEARRFLTSLVRGPEAVLALPNLRSPRVVACVIDTCENSADSAELLLLGIAPNGEHDLRALLEDALRVAALGPRCALDVAVRGDGPWIEAHLVGAGFHRAYSLFDMARPLDDPLALRTPAPPPAGFRWATLPPERAADYRLLLRAAMHGIEGTLFPPEAEFLANARRFAAAGNIHVLLDERTQDGLDAPLAAFVRVRLNADTGVGELCILGRAPVFRGLGLGAQIVARGLQAVTRGGARTAELSVAASNPRALELYEKHGFRRVIETRVFRRALR